MKVELIAASVVTTGAAVPLFAQGGDGAPTTIVGAFIAVSLAMSGLVGLIVKSLLADAKEDRAKFTAALKEIESTNAKRAEAIDARFEVLRGLFEKEQDDLRETFLAEQRAARDHQAKEAAEMRAVLIQSLQGMRTAVHDVKDTSQNVINKLAESKLKEPS